jgi:hypothetical protein
LNPASAIPGRSGARREASLFQGTPAEFAEACRAAQETARAFDWENVIDDWLELLGYR